MAGSRPGTGRCACSSPTRCGSARPTDGRSRRLAGIALAAALALPACTAGATNTGISRVPLDPAVERNLDRIFSEVEYLFEGDIEAAGASGDVRVAWPLVDALRFHQGLTQGAELERALTRLTGVKVPLEDVAWVRFADHLLRRDVRAPPGYLRWKRAMFLGFHRRWEPFFDERADLDWRTVTWGGVLRDAIQALVDPPAARAVEDSWPPADEVVFGVALGKEARAYPRRILEVNELVNDNLGGRRIALSYCTLCGTAVANLIDDVGGRTLELRTSGLLRRSNKLMYDVQTESLFDQFSGRALSGPMLRQGVRLERWPVTVTTWDRWRRAHPDTTVLPREIGGRTYRAAPLGDRDASGPIFPVGGVDGRLPVMEPVFGVVTPEGAAVAFPVATAERVLSSGRSVSVHGVELRMAGGGLSARTADGRFDLAGQQAFWFAWSQFHPRTLLWNPGG